MAWNISKAKRQALVKLQLRDKNGKFIEMGGGVKWYSSRLKKVVAGTVVGTKGNNALVRLNKENPTHEPALVSVPAAGITAIENKASLSPKGDKPSADTTPEFEKPEAVADVKAGPNAEAESDHESQLKGPQHLAENYGVTETPDGNTYITRKDGESIYSSARGLKVGDELIAPAGADPTKPFSIGRGWATKGTERLNKEGEGPVIGKVIAVSENRYAVVQMAGGHTIADRRNPEEQTDTVTVGLSNQVILATMGLKDALGDRVSSQQYADRPSDEDREVSPTAPEAQSDHVGREVPEDQLDSDGQQAPATDRAQVMRDMPVGGRIQTEDGSQVFEKHGDNQWSLATGNGELLDDNSTLNMVKAGEANGLRYQAFVPEDSGNGEKKLSDVSAEEMAQMPIGTVLRDPNGRLAYFIKGEGDNWNHYFSHGKESGAVSSSATVKDAEVFKDHTFAEPGTVPNQNDPANSSDSSESSDAPESPESAPEQQDAPESQTDPESPAEQAPEAAEEAPQTEAPVEDVPEESAGAKATPVNDIVDGLAELEQAAEDIEDSGMDDGEAEDVLNGASFDITAADGSRQTVTAEKDENGDWNYVVADENGAEVASHIIGSDENRVIAERIANPAGVKKDEAPAAEATPEAAPESTPETPEAESYNENGLTEKEQREFDGYTRLASRSYEQFRDDEGDRYKALADELLARGEERKSSAPAEQAETAPESAPQAEEAPEVTPEADKPVEDAPEAPEAPKANVSLADLEAQAKADGDTVLYHGGLPDGTTLDDIDLNRNGTQQNRRGRSYGGFYLTDESSKDWSNSYARQRNGVMHGFAIDKNARIDDRGDQQIDRLSAEERAEAAKTADVIKGKDLLGRTQYVLLNKDAVKAVGETNINDDNSSENSAPTPSLVEPDAAPNEAEKAPVNGEEGFVPVDGRGLKNKEEAPSEPASTERDYSGSARNLPVGSKIYSSDGAVEISKVGDNQWTLDSRNGELMDDYMVDSMVARNQNNFRQTYKESVPGGNSDSSAENDPNALPEKPAEAASGPFGISFERRSDGLDHAVPSNPEAMTDEESQEFARQDIALSWAQHDNRRGAETNARRALADLERRVQSRLDAESLDRQREIQNGNLPGSSNDNNESSSDNESSPEVADTAAEAAPDNNESEAPATEAPAAAPVVDPNANEDGLLPDEAARLADLENRQAAAFRGESNEDPASFDAEISELIRHGRLRGRGREVGPFVARNPAPDAPAQDSQDSPEPAAPEAPAAEAPEAPSAPEAPAPEAPAAPRARRARGGEAVPVADADGNMITRGDKIGHPTLGPVEIINTIPGSGRVEFIDPTTGRKKSVKAARVRKIDPNAAEATPEEQSATVEPGSRFVDAATGKQGFGDKNGNRVLVGDRVTDANGNTGTVKSVYTAANGGAWIPVQWDSDGKTRRVMGNMLEKDNSTAPEATPDAAPEEPLEVARPSASPAPAPEAAPEPAPAPAEEPFEPVMPSATPAPAPAPEAAPEAETPEAATARRQAMVDATPVNSMITSQDGSQKFYRVDEATWQFNEGSLLPPANVVAMLGLGERRGQSYEIAEGRPAQNNLPESATPAVDAPLTPNTIAPEAAPIEIAPEERQRRIGMLRRLPTGTTIRPRSGEYTLTKTGSDDWESTVDNGVYDTEDIYGIIDSGRRGGLLYEVVRPNSGQPVETSAPEPEVALEPNSLVPPTVASRLLAFQRAPIGTTVTSPAGTSTYTKQGPDEWTNPDISGATIKNSTLAIATDSDNGYWVFNKTGPAEPEGTNVTAMTASERSRAFREAPIGSKLVSTGGKVITKTGARTWVTDNGTEYTQAELIFVTAPAQADVSGPFGLTHPEAAAPKDVSSTGGTLPSDRRERKEALSRLPLGSKVKVRQFTFTKVGENHWTEAEEGDNTVYTDMDVSWSGSQATPGVVTLPEPKPIPQDIASRIRVSEEAPIGTVVTSSTGESYTKISDAEWADTATKQFKYGLGEFASKIKNNMYTGDYFVTGFDVPEVVQEPFAGGVLSPDGDEMERQIKSLPVGATVTGGRNNTTFIRREPDVWSSEQNPEEYYNDADLAWRLGLSYGINTPTAALPEPEAPALPPINDQLPVGAFVPSAAGSTSGVKRVGADKWEMIKDGQPTGRFINDEAAAVLQELVGTDVDIPVDPRFGNPVGMSAADLKLPGGKTLGKYLEEGGSYGRLTRTQKAAIEAGYRKFIDNLNTQLPEGFRAELQYVSFGSNSMETSVEFYKGNRALGPATRRFSTSTDSRTNRTVSSVDHAFWALSNDVQGSGISAVFLRASKQMYRQMGLDRITVHADISVGSYAWARSGFDFRSPHYMDSAMSAWDGAWGRAPRGREAEWEEGIRQFRELRARATHANFMAGTHPAAIDFANIGRPTDGNTGADATWFGKQMLSNTHWYGDLILNPTPASGTVAPAA